jgi:hypothetical protein
MIYKQTSEKQNDRVKDAVNPNVAYFFGPWTEVLNVS